MTSTLTPMTAAAAGARAHGSVSPRATDAGRIVEGLRRPAPITLIDVRPPADYAEVHVEGAVSVPLEVLRENAPAVASRLHGDVVLMCGAGVWAEQARQSLVGAGATASFQVLAGGADDVRRAGGTVVRGRRPVEPWSPGRQVGLVAGALVGVGAVTARSAPSRVALGALGAGLVAGAVTGGGALARALADRTPGPAAMPSLDEVLERLPAPAAA
ncbi:rhodanese-like domain-containing protein [Pseudokineococcus basanitobsidens]|uniref:Rhodanese-like domain-containing protein n=1 Tax=Pseudokineococcus basanitobsidens TaxID=1926649 RepID=A0ABU8RKE8_9ACTN